MQRLRPMIRIHPLTGTFGLLHSTQLPFQVARHSLPNIPQLAATLLKDASLFACFPNMAQQASHCGHLIEQVLDDILALDQVDALQPLVGQMAVVTSLPKGHQQRRGS